MAQNYLAVPMEEPKWKSSLLKYRNKLRGVCQIGKFLPALRQLLTDAEYLCVTDKTDDLSRFDVLVRILLTKDSTAFDIFCSVLEANGYPRWARFLKGKGTVKEVQLTVCSQLCM